MTPTYQRYIERLRQCQIRAWRLAVKERPRVFSRFRQDPEHGDMAGRSGLEQRQQAGRAATSRPAT